jgi:hypothetical protein
LGDKRVPLPLARMLEGAIRIGVFSVHPPKALNLHKRPNFIEFYKVRDLVRIVRLVRKLLRRDKRLREPAPEPSKTVQGLSSHSSLNSQISAEKGRGSENPYSTKPAKIRPWGNLTSLTSFFDTEIAKNLGLSNLKGEEKDLQSLSAHSDSQFALSDCLTRASRAAEEQAPLLSTKMYKRCLLQSLYRGISEAGSAG